MSRTEPQRELHQLAHDLRNALSVIYSYAEILKLSLEKEGLEEEQKILEALAESTRKIDTIIAERVDR